MADEHFLTAGDFSSGLGTAPFLGSAGPYAPPPPLLPPGLDLSAFGMLPPWAASELPLPPLPADPSAATSAHFDSALSSLVSSPGGHANGACGDDVAIGDLIGRLGSIICNTAASANNSCYSTPLSSPPHGASPAAAAAFRWGCYAHPAGAAPPLETGFADGTMSRVASSKSLGAAAAAALTSENAETETRASPEAAGAGSNKTEAPAGKGDGGSGAARKRKASGGKQGKTAAAVTTVNPKKSKVAGDDKDAAAEEEKKAEPVKDYIHVRARRGQATDSHSLAERVRREKISERMKLLQSLVPGCNKITGKALMLDEIINYVQSLQRQVEFLSMKLSTMNPQPLDVDAQYQLPSHSDKDMMMHYETGTAPAMLGYHQAHHQDAFSYADPFAGAAAHHPTMESCTGHPGGGVREDTAAAGLQSVVHRRDTDQSQQHPTAGHGRFHGK